jgi:hypothetical protein
MTLIPITITNQLDWLSNSYPTGIMPGLARGHEAYLRILPPLGIDPAIPTASFSFAQRTPADLNARAAFWDKYGIIQGQPTPSRLIPITYRKVAATLGIPYDSTFTAASIVKAYGGWPPHLGTSPTLCKAFAQQLVQVLGSDQEAYFYGCVDEGTYRFDSDGLPADWLEQGQVADLTLYYHEGPLPTYFFAVDHSWCFYQGEWSDELIVGCSNKLANALLAHPSLEVLHL